MRRHEKLLARQKCHRFALTVYRLTQDWPVRERYGLTAQLRRAAVSAPANIVEGSVRRGKREFRRFLNISLTSLAECEYLLRLASDLNLVDTADYCTSIAEFGEARALTWLLYRSQEG